MEESHGPRFKGPPRRRGGKDPTQKVFFGAWREKKSLRGKRRKNEEKGR